MFPFALFWVYFYANWKLDIFATDVHGKLRNNSKIKFLRESSY